MHIKKLEGRIGKSDKFQMDISFLANKMLMSTVIMLILMLIMTELEEGWNVPQILLSVLWSISVMFVVFYQIKVLRLGLKGRTLWLNHTTSGRSRQA